MAKRKTKQNDNGSKLDSVGSTKADSGTDGQAIDLSQPDSEKSLENAGIANNGSRGSESGLIANNAETKREPDSGQLTSGSLIGSANGETDISNESDEKQAENDDQSSRILMSQNDQLALSTSEPIVRSPIVPSHGRGLLTPMLPGKTLNPHGRPAAGLRITEWYNVMASSKWSASRARSCWRDESAPMAKRAAAKQWLDTLGLDDLAEFEDVIDGKQTLKAARSKGLRTDAIKKMKVRKRTDESGNEVVEREIELHPDRSGQAIDRIADRTVGKPSQTSLVATVSLDPQARAAAAIEQARALLGLADGVVRTA